MANFTLTKNTNYQAGNGVGLANDSGSIVTIPQPGGSAAKLTDGTQQSATTATCDSTIPAGGNYITKAQVATYGPAGNSKGYSILGE